uniref:Uncharacterized LOC100175766 n=1 Tax=Ciona intestinalis TaxID=7719 RepID=F6WUN4_CIOIN|nr:uncharacterized protein LOC100175766 [Ciona intestinalis]|eukprot:XP_002125877.1 uncharacterized protein LOC100175766 [Ciona intestinalis]
MSRSGYDDRHGGSSDRYAKHSRRSGDRHRRDKREYYYSNDSYKSDHSRRVPGLVSDPDRRGGTADDSISRGQRSTMDRYNTSSHAGVDIIRGNSRATKDVLSPPTYTQHVSTITQHYNPISHKDSLTTKRKRLPINPTFLSILPALAGVALMVAAIIVVDWKFKLTVLSNQNQDIQVTRIGLFQACFQTIMRQQQVGAPTCTSVESFNSGAGQTISDLEQATRAMLIISAIIGFGALLVNIYLGFNRWERARGALVVGGFHLFAGYCGVAGMGCYSSLIASSTQTTTITIETAGTSFYLGWCGVAFMLTAATMCFLAHCAKRK